MINNFVVALGVVVHIMQGADNPSRTREFACYFAAQKYSLDVQTLLSVTSSGEKGLLRNINTHFVVN